MYMYYKNTEPVQHHRRHLSVIAHILCACNQFCLRLSNHSAYRCLAYIGVWSIGLHLYIRNRVESSIAFEAYVFWKRIETVKLWSKEVHSICEFDRAICLFSCIEQWYDPKAVKLSVQFPASISQSGNNEEPFRRKKFGINTANLNITLYLCTDLRFLS